jgi:hypothetical protein
MTLIDVLVGTALMVIIFTALSSLLITALKVSELAKAHSHTIMSGLSEEFLQETFHSMQQRHKMVGRLLHERL